DENGIMIITHHNRILDYIDVDYVHVLIDGKIVKSGTMELAKDIEENGYEELKKEVEECSYC
ncbi:MAG: Fe-S cluster assembly ATPase SufC, partial [Bacillota bacterium]